MDIYDFAEKIDSSVDGWDDGLVCNEEMLPCFCHRFTVLDQIKTPYLIKQYLKVASEYTEKDVLVFSVTERDTCWQAWKDYAIAHPKTFTVVQGGSLHGVYQCRMYIYTKPKRLRRHG